MVAVADSQMAAAEVQLAATSVKAVLSAPQNHCSTTNQPFDSANSKNLSQNQYFLFNQ